MKKLDNCDLRLAGGLALRSDMKIIINEVIDRLNELYELLENQEVIDDSDTNYLMYSGYVVYLDTIFNFLFACQIFSARTYREYFESLFNMNLAILDRKVR